MMKLRSRVFTSAAIASLTAIGLSAMPSLAQITEPIEPMNTPAEGMMSAGQMEQMMGDGPRMMNDSNYQPRRMN